MKHKKIISVALSTVLALGVLTPVQAEVLPNIASGISVYSNAKATVDASNSKDGYVMVKYNEPSKSRLKVRITGQSGTVYVYDLNRNGNYEAFPLSDGEGKYTIGVYENITGNKYAIANTTSINVVLTDSFAPFLRPNQYVNFTADSDVVAKAAELVGEKKDSLEKIAAIYDYVVTNFTYDKEKAKTVQSGYLPDVDAVLKAQKGICFDYASVMTAMLRSQSIPTKLVIGYTGDTYHAWVNTYIPEKGWLDGIIYFDGTTWKLMDPTFASSAKQSASIMEYIGNGDNYKAKYLY